jgi:hypothetical protein
MMKSEAALRTPSLLMIYEYDACKAYLLSRLARLGPRKFVEPTFVANRSADGKRSCPLPTYS